jgi:hypothetical protein
MKSTGIIEEEVPSHLKIQSGKGGWEGELAEDGSLWYQFVTTRGGLD